jgi:acetyl esterase/lipase
MRTAALVGLMALAGVEAPAQQLAVKREKDVIYGRTHGLALTLDVFTPAEPNGYGVVFVVSGGWFSRPENINQGFVQPFLTKGYTCFAVVHGSQPRFTLPEIMEHMHRGVRFIRFNAKKYKIDPDKIGITGASAGGHLSLMMGTSGKDGNKNDKDAVERVSSKVQAVGCFFPPTDFLNWGKEGDDFSDRKLRAPFTAAVDFHEFDAKKAMYQRVTDKAKLREAAAKVSPITHLGKDSAPALIFHGDKDELVPIYQAETYVAKAKDKGASAKLVVREGKAHGWPTILLDIGEIAEWFDEHLRGKKGE